MIDVQPVHGSRPRGNVLRLAAGLLAWLCATVALAQELQIIELHHRRADEVLPVLQPLLAPGGAISGLDDKLLVRTTPANLAQIRKAAAAIDIPQKQLLITVSQGTAANLDAAGLYGTATIGSGDVSVGVNRPPGTQSGVAVSGGSRQLQTGHNNVSTVRAVEGVETWISVGQFVPLTTTTVVSPGWGGGIQQSTEYKDVTTGFYATARVNGDTVTLEISPQQQSYRPSGDGTIQTRGASTVVSGRLGEWIELGAVRESGSSSGRGALVWSRHTDRSQYSAWVRVEAAGP